KPGTEVARGLLSRSMVPNRFVQVGLASVVLFMIACGSSARSEESGDPSQTTHTERYCPGARVADAQIVGCPSPASVRPGYACHAAATCPSPNGLFGDCRCVSSSHDDTGRWTCDSVAAPAG